MFAWQDSRGAVEVGFTAGSLDLALGADAANLDVVRGALVGGPRSAGDRAPVLVGMRQVHEATATLVDSSVVDGGEVPVCDALVTRLPGVALLVRVADCVPLLLADPDAGVVAAVHAGRPGLAAGVVPAALRAMRDQGATRVTAWVGPHVCGGCYEVPDTMRAEVAQVVPASWAETSWGTPALDIGAGVRAQLLSGEVDGVEVADVRDVARCTVEDDDLYSYRRQGRESGRLGGLVWMRP
ncbi:MAG: purine-nucleoside/S-methyl-5-thioadenosine phosphorylase / adenosine deaminase [Nocardioidaceae bacterium]|nr:purine-nucleoside/S-methyl-5-thioadenosine phosphorylase / adenosine deaminase [Nocardioidaceae bacterium]